MRDVDKLFDGESDDEKAPRLRLMEDNEEIKMYNRKICAVAKEMAPVRETYDRHSGKFETTDKEHNEAVVAKKDYLVKHKKQLRKLTSKVKSTEKTNKKAKKDFDYLKFEVDTLNLTQVNNQTKLGLVKKYPEQRVRFNNGIHEELKTHYRETLTQEIARRTNFDYDCTPEEKVEIVWTLGEILEKFSYKCGGFRKGGTPYEWVNYPVSYSQFMRMSRKINDKVPAGDVFRLWSFSCFNEYTEGSANQKKKLSVNQPADDNYLCVLSTCVKKIAFAVYTKLDISQA